MNIAISRSSIFHSLTEKLFRMLAPKTSPPSIRWRDAHALSDVTAFQIWLQMAHRFVALIIAIGIIAFWFRVRRLAPRIGCTETSVERCGFFFLPVRSLLAPGRFGATKRLTSRPRTLPSARRSLAWASLLPRFVCDLPAENVPIDSGYRPLVPKERPRRESSCFGTTPQSRRTNPAVVCFSDFSELVKARLTLLVLLTTAVGYYLGAARPISYAAIFSCCFRNRTRRGRRSRP